MKGTHRFWACTALALSASVSFAQRSTITESSAPAPTEIITFAQAIAKAGANQPLILRAQAAVQSARAKVGQAESDYFPQMTVQAGYDRLSVKQEIELGTDSVELTPENVYDFKLDAGLLVYDFGKRELQVKLAKNGVDSALVGVDQIRQDIAYQIARIYCRVVSLKAEVKELEDEIAALNEHLEIAKKNEEEGSSTHLDVISAQVRLSRVTNRRIDLANTLAKQKIALRQLMGLALDKGFEVDAEFPRWAATGDSQSLVALALANRPEIQAAMKTEGAAQLGRSVVELGGYPRIALHGEAGYRNGLLDSTNQDASSLVFNWSLGLLVTLPVFDGFRSARASDEAAATTEAAHQESEERRRTVTTQVLQALQDLSASGARAASVKAQLEQAKEYLNMSKIQYDLGAGTGSDHLDAIDAFSLAGLDELDFRLQEALGGLALRQAIGDRIWSDK
jgi:outer membrane protein TolC